MEGDLHYTALLLGIPGRYCEKKNGVLCLDGKVCGMCEWLVIGSVERRG